MEWCNDLIAIDVGTVLGRSRPGVNVIEQAPDAVHALPRSDLEQAAYLLAAQSFPARLSS